MENAFVTILSIYPLSFFDKGEDIRIYFPNLLNTYLSQYIPLNMKVSSKIRGFAEVKL